MKITQFKYQNAPATKGGRRALATDQGLNVMSLSNGQAKRATATGLRSERGTRDP